MATKLSTLISIVTGYFSSTQLNSNFSDIADEFDNTLSRDGTSPNTMSADFDLNDNDLLNAKDINADNMYIAGTKVVATTAVPTWQGAWVTSTAYALDDMVKDSGNSYICIIAHTSGTFATDLAAAKWDTMATKGATGAGTGDLLASNNLSDVTSANTARTNLGLVIGTDVQAQDDALDDIAGLTQATNKIPYFSSASAASVLDFVDEDDMTSDSATALASQQSIKAYSDGTSSLAATGYQVLPSGLIIQWGSLAFTADEDVTFTDTFPLTFTNVWSVTLTQEANYTTAYDAFEVYLTSKSTTGFNGRVGASSGSTFGTGTIMWMAMGN